MNETIKRLNPGEEFYTPERCFIIELSNVPDDPDASIARARVTPGVTTRWHRLIGTAERYVILEGEGLVEVGSLLPQGCGRATLCSSPRHAGNGLRTSVRTI